MLQLNFFGTFILLCLNLIAFSSVGYLGFVHPIGIELVPLAHFYWLVQISLRTLPLKTVWEEIQMDDTQFRS